MAEQKKHRGDCKDSGKSTALMTRMMMMMKMMAFFLRRFFFLFSKQMAPNIYTVSTVCVNSFTFIFVSLSF